MILKKKVQGHTVKLELEKIKDYPRYSLYQVYKLEGKKRVPLYRECYTQLQIDEIILKNYWITEEVFS